MIEVINESDHKIAICKYGPIREKKSKLNKKNVRTKILITQIVLSFVPNQPKCA